MNNYYSSGKQGGQFTVRAFVDMKENSVGVGGRAGQYDIGEPFKEHNFTLLTAQKLYGINLIPEDPSPTLQFKDNNLSYADINITVSQDTNLTTDWEWLVEAFDPLYGSNNMFSPDLNDTNIYGPLGSSIIEYADIYGTSQISFLIDGNFTQFLSAKNDGNSTANASFDLVNIPSGMWGLTYQAIDEHNNTSTVLEQNITIIDGEPPFITILDADHQTLVSTLELSDANASSIIGSTALSSYDINQTTNGYIWKWDYGTEFRFSDWSSDSDSAIRVHVMDTKDELISDWNVTVDFNNTIVDLNLSDFNATWQSTKSYSNYPLSADDFGVYSISDSAEDGVYRLTFRAEDDSGNSMSFYVFLIIEEGYSAEITAVDGYLENASVIFDANNDGISDLGRQFFTDSNGRARIILTKEEFQKFDTNQNGKLDSTEGKFIVIGGTDTSTGAVFSGKLIADANSTVVSPLTTMISRLMDLGASKSEAISALAIALDLDPSIDYTVYDPIARAFNGDSEATKIMSANLRMANLVNQAEGLLLTLSSDYQGHAVGTHLLGEVAKYLQQTQSGGVIDLESALIEAIPIALASVGTAGELALEDQLAMFQLMAELDNSLLESTEPTSFEELMTPKSHHR